MVSETLSSPIPQIDNQQISGVKTRPSAVQQAAVKKSTSVNPAERFGGRQQRLVVHLLIGFLMAFIAFSGYIFLGPHAHASATDQTGNHIVNVATNVPPDTVDLSAINDQNQMSDIADMQAEMDEITRQLNALKAQNTSSNVTESTIYNSTPRNSQDQVSARLDQMISMMNDIMSKMNGINTPTSGTSAPASGTGHVHY